MRISALVQVMSEIQSQHGDLEVFCGTARIRGFAIEPAALAVNPKALPGEKVVSFIFWREADGS